MLGLKASQSSRFTADTANAIVSAESEDEYRAVAYRRLAAQPKFRARLLMKEFGLDPIDIKVVATR